MWLFSTGQKPLLPLRLLLARPFFLYSVQCKFQAFDYIIHFFVLVRCVCYFCYSLIMLSTLLAFYVNGRKNSGQNGKPTKKIMEIIKNARVHIHSFATLILVCLCAYAFNMHPEEIAIYQIECSAVSVSRLFSSFFICLVSLLIIDNQHTLVAISYW